MQHVEGIESPVPMLKVMRLQKPQLHMPSAGTLDTKCILTSSMCLPDSFGVIRVGETFSAYLGALNISQSLSITQLTVSAQLQTPSQRWHLASNLDEGNARGGFELKPLGGIDTIVSHALEEIGQHILRVEVGYGTLDGSIKTLRKFYRFQVSNPLTIQEQVVRVGDGTCFVSLSLQNNATDRFLGGISVYSVHFEPASGLVAECVDLSSNDKGMSKEEGDDVTNSLAMYDDSGRLDVGESVRYIFKVTASEPPSSLRGIAAGDPLGKAVFFWRKSLGESGEITSHAIICSPSKPVFSGGDELSPKVFDNSFLVHRSGLAVDVALAAAARDGGQVHYDQTGLDTLLPVTVEPVDPPSKIVPGIPFEVAFLIVNHSPRAMTLQLQFRMDEMLGLKVCGAGHKTIGDVAGSGGSTTASSRFVAFEGGMLRATGCCIVDLATGQSIAQPPLFAVLAESE